MKKHILITTLLITMLGSLLSACNTMEGLGKDTERAGQKIQDNAK